MDFSKFVAVENSNTRKPGTKGAKKQLFTDLKYRKAINKKTKELESRFFVSNAKFAELGLETLGLRQFTAADGATLLGVVADVDAKILKLSKRGKKTHGFKSTKLETALNALKIIDSSKEAISQYIDLVLEGENCEIYKVHCVKAFSFKVGTELVIEKKPTPIEEAAAASAGGSPSLESTIKPTPEAAKTPVAAGEWD